MSEKTISTVILIDDNDGDNFLHRLVIDKAGVASEVLDFTDAEDALEYLAKNECSANSLIFLDINMPRMDGFEFLEEYRKLPDDIRRLGVVIMLTTSLNPSDRERADDDPYVKEYLNKPLSIESVRTVARRFFGE